MVIVEVEAVAWFMWPAVRLLPYLPLVCVGRSVERNVPSINDT